MGIEWDEAKRLSNLEKHGLDFARAALLFAPGGRLLAALDKRKKYGEDRFLGFGWLTHRVVAVCFTVRGQCIRMISLRKANQRETKSYAQAIKSLQQHQE